MGGYEQIFASEEITEEKLSNEEAIAAIAFVSAFADDEGSEQEKEVIAELLLNLDEFSDYSEEDIIDVLAKIETLADEYGLGALFNTAIESITEDMASTAFGAAVFVILADGEIPPQEEDFLYELQQSLGLSNEEASEIMNDIITAAEMEEFVEDEETL